MKHRKFGGSTAARTIACPGWHQESEGIPRSSSVFAAVGTALHDCMEDMLLEGTEPEDYIGVTIKGVEITEELVRDKLNPALEAFDELCVHYNVEEFEPEVECSYAEDIGGYSDVVVRGEIEDRVYIIILDWKFGDGVLVSPEESPQAMFYGMAARAESAAKDLFEGATHFVAAIIQPTDRADTLSTWEAPIEVLDQFEKQHTLAVKAAKGDDPELGAGPHCKFCPAQPFCPEKTGAALRALQMDAEDLEQLTDSMELVGELKDWISAVEKAAFRQLEVGAEVPGWKLVAKRAMAKWKDEESVVKKLRRHVGGIKNMYKKSLLTPAQMRKLLKAHDKDLDIDDLIVKTSSGNTLAREDDKRPAVLSSEALGKALSSIE